MWRREALQEVSEGPALPASQLGRDGDLSTSVEERDDLNRSMNADFGKPERKPLRWAPATPSTAATCAASCQARSRAEASVVRPQPLGRLGR